MITIHPPEWLKSLLPYPAEPSSASVLEATGFVALTGAYIDPTVIRILPVISRLPRRIRAEDHWLGAARSVASLAAQRGWTMIASGGGSGWEYSAWCAARAGARLMMVLPPGRTERMSSLTGELARDMNLDREFTSFLMPVATGKPTKPERLHLRDRLALALAHRRCPLTLRPGGFWEGLLATAEGVDRSFQGDYPGRWVEPWRGDNNWLVTAQSHRWDDVLVHWTRGSYAPWPGESRADYFAALTAAASGNPRDGLATIVFIAGCGILRAQGRMFKGGAPAVSFTPLEPERLPELIKYRAALGRWSFEPYGIALPEGTLQRLGARPVIYGERELLGRLPTDEIPYFQYHGKGDNGEAGWRREREWRLVGDLDISSVRDDVLLITPTEAEAQALRETLSYPVASLERGQSRTEN